MQEIIVEKKIDWLFYIPMAIGCFMLIPIGLYMIENKENVIGYCSLIAGLSLVIAYFRLLMSELFG